MGEDPLALADHEEALSLWLARHGVAREWALAPPLAAAGVDLAWCERAAMAMALAGSALEPGLEWVASTFSIGALLSEMKESTQRISELVAAIKSYSQMDRASMQRIDVTEGIDSALVMLGHKLGTGIAVVRDYGASVPRIHAYPGELNQVWTSLIDNALDAMNGAGTLRLATRVEDDDIVVEVGDTGPGMPPQVASRAFDAFYRPRTRAKAPVSASTSPGAQSWSATAASSPSTPGPGTRCCRSASPSGRPGALRSCQLTRSRSKSEAACASASPTACHPHEPATTARSPKAASAGSRTIKEWTSVCLDRTGGRGAGPAGTRGACQ